MQTAQKTNAETVAQVANPKTRRARLVYLVRRADRRFWDMLADDNTTADDCETVLCRRNRAIRSLGVNPHALLAPLTNAAIDAAFNVGAPSNL